MRRKKNKDLSQTQNSAPAVVVNDLTLVAPDRSRKDIATLKSALERAESIQLPNRAKLYNLYDDVVSLDGHLSGIINKRIKSASNKQIYVEDSSGKRVEAFDSLLKSLQFKNFKKIILEQLIFGASGVEFLRGSNFDFVEIPRKHIRPEYAEIARSQWDNRGISYADNSELCIFAEPRKFGALLRCAMYALYKRSGIGDFAQFVEIFGQPVRIIYYDTYDTQTKDELRKMAETAGSSLVMMIPKQAQFEMLDGKTSNGDGSLQISFLQFCNQEMSVAILGNSETTLSSSSSGYAQAEIHEGQQLEITADDIDFLIGTLNSPKILNILKSYGLPVDGVQFKVEKELNLEKLTKRLAIDREVANRVPVSDDYWYDTYGIPKPNNYDQLKAEQLKRQQASLAAQQKSKDEKNTKKEKKGIPNHDAKLSEPGVEPLDLDNDFFV